MQRSGGLNIAYGADYIPAMAQKFSGHRVAEAA
jgi:hypothetical protein